MTRLLFIILFIIALPSSVSAKPVHFLCKSNIDDGEYPLMIDIDNKLMIRIGTEYKMKISEGYLTGIHNENKPFETRIVLNKYNLDLNVNFFSNGKLNLISSYKTNCRKIKKQI
jgi:hypothetical protein